MVSHLDCIHKYGEPTVMMEHQHLTLWDIPEWINSSIPELPNRVYCNRDLIKPLQQAFQNIIDRDLCKLVKTWDGCFNIRLKRGGSNWSLHSWAIAIDINAAWNGLGKEPQMPQSLVNCFTDAGFDWGGTWRRPDGMHFQLAMI